MGINVDNMDFSSMSDIEKIMGTEWLNVILSSREYNLLDERPKIDSEVAEAIRNSQYFQGSSIQNIIRLSEILESMFARGELDAFPEILDKFRDPEWLVFETAILGEIANERREQFVSNAPQAGEKIPELPVTLPGEDDPGVNIDQQQAPKTEFPCP